MGRTYALVVSIALLGATLSPLLRSPDDDGFPLSTYPMFALDRPTRLVLTYALATGAHARHAISPDIIGSQEPMQAMAILETAMVRAPDANALCERIAARIATDDDYADATAVQIVTGTHDAVDYLLHQVAGNELERAHCGIVR